MTSIFDEEFGDIAVRRSVRSSSIRISVTPTGTLKASMPPYAPIFVLKRFVKSSRPQLRAMLQKQGPAYKIENGAEIGKSHKLIVKKGITTGVKRYGQQILVILAPDDELTDPSVERLVRDMIIKCLRIEAKSYLPKRLEFLADKLGCHYETVRFSHSGGRWGSCSSTGTISLNIALMKLPFPLIDYVIIHELCHTKQMNHSPKFWSLVESADPSYKLHRKMLKSHSPAI